ncbi:MAG: 50S ribosomal protein L15 [Gammaproteobacteria bacterium]|nr:50S ribosomal protein L15 [Gammaproteobacteria bacterium]
MRLNEISPAPGSRQNRVRAGRGASAGRGKTCGRGHKGQNSRSGGGVRIGFEGGQLPLQKRVPTYGFKSRKGRTTAEVRLSELKHIEGDQVTLATLLSAGILHKNMKRARIIHSGEVDRAYQVSGVHVTKNAKVAIEAAGGSIQE